MAVPTIDSIPTLQGEVARALITVGDPAKWYSRFSSENIGSFTGDLELSATLQIDRIWWASGSDRLFRLQRNPPGITQPGPEDDMSEWVAGSGAGKAVFLLFDGIGVPIQIDVSTVFSSGGAFVNLVAAPAAASLLDGIAVGDLVNFVVADAGQPPVAVGEIETVTLEHDGSTNLDIARYFADPVGQALAYSAASGDPAIVTAALVGPTLTLTAVSEGSATVTVTATDPGGLSLDRNIGVSVLGERTDIFVLVRTARLHLRQARERLSRAADLKRLGRSMEAADEEQAARVAIAAVRTASQQAMLAATAATEDAARARVAVTAAQATFNARNAELPTLQQAVTQASTALDTARDVLLAAPDPSLPAAVGTYTAAKTSVDTAVATLQAKIDQVNTAARTLGDASETALTTAAAAPVAVQASRLAANLDTQAQALLT